MRTGVDGRQNDTEGDRGTGNMAVERVVQQTGRVMLRWQPRLRLLCRWGMIALGVMPVVSAGRSGRTFASLIAGSRGGSQVRSATFLPSPTVRVERATRDVAFRELELLRSIELGELAHAEALVAAGVSANAKDPHGWTPLMLAALHNRIPLIPVLYTNGADLNAHNRKGTTALMLAANNGHKEMVRLLLDQGAQVNAKATDGWTALMYAAWKGHSAIVSDLLRVAADPTATDSQHWTPLMYAAWQGHTETVAALLASQKKRSLRESDR